MIKSFLFPQTLNKLNGASVLLLVLRVVFGVLLMMHGFQKLTSFDVLAAGAFPDPLGIGGTLSVSLAIFGELFCSAAFILGFLYRLSMIPMIVTLLVAFIFVHKFNIAEGELALVYLVSFIGLYVAGPGRFSVDALISRRLNAAK